mgnify:CR=1 FL=1
MFKFYLETATYYILDDNGNKIRLRVDYWNNGIVVENLTLKNSKIIKLQDKAKTIGKNLLSRKHKVDFAYKYENL